MIYKINDLEKNLKEGSIQKLYLLFGDEAYLKEYYRDCIVAEIKEIEGREIEINKVVGSKDPDELYELAETTSMFGESKILIMKNTGWFKNDAKESFERYGFLIEPRDYLYVIFLEDSVAKNKKIYKEVEAKGMCVDVSEQSDDQKEKWMVKRFEDNNLKAGRSVCRYIINNCERDYLNLNNEVEKLILFKKPGEAITEKDVDEVCIRIISSKIFALTDGISERNTKKALKAMHDLVYMGEPVERIFFMVCRYFRLMKQIKELVLEGNGTKAASVLKINPYEANQFIKNSAKFTIEILKKAQEDCLGYDVARKNGEIDYKDAMELLIINYSNR